MFQLPSFVRLFIGLFSLSLLGINTANACVDPPDPDTIITVTVNHSDDLQDITIILGNLKFMTEAPNVFCSCAIGSLSDFYTHLDYVAFVETGTTIPYPNMAAWENNVNADQAWTGEFPSNGNWRGFVAEVINGGLGPSDDVELLIRASVPDGYFLNINDIDSTMTLSTLGTDAWDVNDQTLLLDHTGLRSLGDANNQIQYVLQPDDYFTAVDAALLSTSINDLSLLDVQVYPNPASTQINVRFDVPTAGEFTLSIQDLSGRLLFTQRRRLTIIGRHEEPIELPGNLQLDGLYLLTVQNERYSGTFKFMIRP